MERKTIVKIISSNTAFTLIAGSFIGVSFLNNSKIIKSDAASLPTTLDLSDCTDEEIRSYYSALKGKDEDELKGENLLKNLKGIIKNISYFSYDNDTSIYVITDRDWENSPASSLPGTYDPETNRVTGYSHSTDISNNPYIHMLYHDYSVKDKTHYQGDGDVSTSTKSFDNEHAWSQSHGFSAPGGDNSTGAGSDLHHLIAGTQYGNRTLHSNYSYGFVNTPDTSSVPTVDQQNKRGTPLFPHSSDQQAKVFEPQDSDKGDIARALLYMVACYNNYDGSTPTQAIPALKLVNYVISENTKGYSSDNLENGYYGILQDLLAWHYIDPVDDYEIHRNNLIYRNYQHNRNPFIDFPEWVDYIWGTSEYDAEHKTITYDSTPTGIVDVDHDPINGDSRKVTKIEVKKLPDKTTYKVGDKFDRTGMVVEATYDDNSTGDVSKKCTVSVDLSTKGEKDVTVSYRGQSASFKIKVEDSNRIPMWLIIVIVVVVAVLLIGGISIGVITVNKKGRVKVKKSGVKKVVKKATKKKKK